jgi:hypothetical protein
VRARDRDERIAQFLGRSVKLKLDSRLRGNDEEWLHLRQNPLHSLRVSFDHREVNF